MKEADWIHLSILYQRSVKLDMRTKSICLLFLFVLSLQSGHAQGTVPTFQHAIGQRSYTLAGRDPAKGGTTTIPTVLVPIELSFDARKSAGKSVVMDATADVSHVLRSPIFSRFAFEPGNTTQYADAMLRSTFPKADGWHTLLGKPEVKPVKITVPVGYGYILTSKKTGSSFAVVDVEFLQRELFKQLPRQDGKLVIALTHNTTFYSDGDATECCSWGPTESIPPPETPSYLARIFMLPPPSSKTATYSRSLSN
jgi:chitinase